MNDDSRFISPQESGVEEQAFDISLRPKVLADFVGQPKTRDQLKIFIEAAKKTRRGT